MSRSGNYKDRELVNRAYESILDVIKPGDVVAWIGSHRWWEIWSAIIHAGFRRHQRRLKFFDLGKRKKVCSVGVRTVISEAIAYMYARFLFKPEKIS